MLCNVGQLMRDQCDAVDCLQLWYSVLCCVVVCCSVLSGLVLSPWAAECNICAKFSIRKQLNCCIKLSWGVSKYSVMCRGVPRVLCYSQVFCAVVWRAMERNVWRRATRGQHSNKAPTPLPLTQSNNSYITNLYTNSLHYSPPTSLTYKTNHCTILTHYPPSLIH